MLDKRPKKKRKRAGTCQRSSQESTSSQPASPYTTLEKSEKSKESTSSSDIYTLSSFEESEGWRTPPSKKNKTWAEVPASTNVKKNIHGIVPVNKSVTFI